MSSLRPQWNFAGVANQLSPQVRERLLTINLLIGSVAGVSMLLVSAVTNPKFDILHPVMIGLIGLQLFAFAAGTLPRLPDMVRAATLAIFCVTWACVVLAYVGPSSVTALFLVFFILLAGFLYGAPGLIGSLITIICLNALTAVLWIQGILPLVGSHHADPTRPSYWLQVTVSFLAPATMICGLVYYLLRRTTEYFHLELDLRESLLQERTRRSEAELERLRTELARKDAERLLSTVYRAAPIGLALVRERRLVLVNDWIATRFGDLPEALVGRPTRCLYLDEAEYERVGRVVKDAFDAGGIATVETRLQSPSGATLDVLLTAAPLCPTEGEGDIVVTISDITAMKAASEAVRESEARLSEIFDHTSEIIFTVSMDSDEHFRITRVNRAAAHYGFFMEQLQSCNCRIADIQPVGITQEIICDFRQCVQSRASLTTVRSMPTATGPVKFSTTLVPVIDPETQRAVRLVGFSRDLSHTERIDELQRSKMAADAANQTKSVFLSNMSHEIRTPLNAVLGFTRLLLREEKLTGIQRTYLETVDRNGQHLLHLINDILEISKIEAAKVVLRLEPCAIRGLLTYLDATFAPAATAKGIRFTTRCDADVPQMVKTDEGKLRQILVNLVGNAVKFTVTGAVEVSLYAQTGEAGSHLCVDVTDTGPGISPEDQTAIFQEFKQTEEGRRAGGSGLGLKISRGHARLLGGDITVASTVGLGSVFTLSIPRIQSDLAGSSQNEDQESRRRIRLVPGSPPVRLLVVDDVNDNRLLLASILHEAGFSVREATNGQEAMQVASAWHPHCALIDMKMPGLDGVGVTQLLRSKPSLSSLKIIGISASVFSEEAEKFLAAGADAFLPKPVNEVEIMRALSGLLALYTTTEALASDTVLNTRPSAPQAPASSRLVELDNAAAQADYSSLVHLVAQIADENPDLARLLDHHLQRFDYETIRGILTRHLP